MKCGRTIFVSGIFGCHFFFHSNETKQLRTSAHQSYRIFLMQRTWAYAHDPAESRSRKIDKESADSKADRGHLRPTIDSGHPCKCKSRTVPRGDYCLPLLKYDRQKGQPARNAMPRLDILASLTSLLCYLLSFIVYLLLFWARKRYKKGLCPSRKTC